MRIPVLLLMILSVLLGLAAAARAETYAIDAVARPQRVPYTEGVKVTVSVTVSTNQGALVNDGIPVYFHTTLGSVPTVAYTQRGQVNVLLENSVGAGTAILTVTVGDSQRVVNIDFVGQASAAVTSTAPARVSYRLKANTVYYSVDKRRFDLRDNAQFVAPSFTLTANALQYDVSDGVITAQGGVTMIAGKRRVDGEKLYLQLSTNSGALIQVQPSISYQTFSLPDLSPTVSEVENTGVFAPLVTLPTHTWIVCRQAVVYPNDQIHFRAPQFYLDNFDRRLYSLPYHVLDLRSSDAGMLFNSRITLTSDAGLNVDFPVYYAASDSHIGSLHVREVTKGSEFYRGTSGLQLSMEEEYLMGRDADGALYLDDLSRNTRSASWFHNQDIGHTHVNLSAAYDRYTESTPYTTRFGAGVSQELGRVNLRFNGNWSQFQGNTDTYGEFGAYLPTWMLGRTHVGLSVNPFIGFRQSIAGATSTTPKTTKSNFYQGVTNGLSLPTLQALGGSLTTSLSYELSHEQSGLITHYFDAGASFHRQLGRAFSGSLSYSYGLSRTNRDAVKPDPTQRLGMDIYGGRSSVWQMSGYSSYDLNVRTLFSSGSFVYYLPWQRTSTGQPRWHVRATASVSSGNGSASDQLFSLGRDLGAYTLVFHYSPTGNMASTGLGTGTGRHWSFELQRAAW